MNGSTDAQPVVLVLGPVTLVEPDGTTVALGSARLRSLLAALTVRPNTTADAGWLADAVWADDQPANPVAALHTLVSRLRSLLAATEIIVRTVPTGYRLDVGPGRIDADAARAALPISRAQLRTDPEHAVETLEVALARWRGEAYEEFREAAFARSAVAGLSELRTELAESLAAGYLAAGRPDDGAAVAGAVVAAQPLREHAHALLIRAHRHAGRTADALACFATARRIVADELGVEPGPELQALHRELLAADRPVEADRRLPAVRRAAPMLVGRDADLSAIETLLETSRLLTLLGPGGVGKTSLARAVAAGHDPVWFIELAGVGQGGQVAAALATRLGVPPRPDGSPLDGALRMLRGRRGLLVLDNCEHLVGAAADIAAAVVDHCPDVSVLATSRLPLRTPAEQCYPVPPLDTDGVDADAARLFGLRARAADPAWTAEPEQVARLCRRLDGLPLAIELAAARVRAFGVVGVHERLAGRFRLLDSGSRTAEPRQRTLWNTVDWSYRLLEPTQRRALEILAVFAGTFPLSAAERMIHGCPAAGLPVDEVAVAVGALVDHSLLVPLPVESDGRPRYRMLATVRDFGATRLGEAGLDEPVRQAHAELYAEELDRTVVEYGGSRHAAMVDAVAVAFDDVRQAVGWAIAHDIRLAARLVGGLFSYLEHRLAAEVAGWAADLIGRADLVGTDRAGRVYAVAAAGFRLAGNLAAAAAAVERGRELAADDAFARGCLAYLRGELALFAGDLETAERIVDDIDPALARFGVAGMVRGTGLLATGYAHGWPAVADALVELDIEHRRRGALTIAAWARYSCGELQLDTDPPAARAALLSALDDARQLDERYLIGVSLVALASHATRHGDPADALPVFADAVRHWYDAGDWTHQWVTLRNVAELLATVGAWSDAAVLDAALGRPRVPPTYGDDAGRARVRADRLAAALPASEITRLQGRGSAMTDDEAVAFALEALRRAQKHGDGSSR